MRTILYNGCLIRHDGCGNYTAQFYDSDGDSCEVTTRNLAKAKAAIDAHPFNCVGKVVPIVKDVLKPKAKLVTFSITTRVVTMESGYQDFDEEEAFNAARNKILDDADEYLIWDNIDFIEDDKECPYDPDTDTLG